MHLQSIISIHLTGELATTQWLHEFLQQQQHQQWQQTSYFTFDSFFRHSFQSTCAGRVRDFCEKFLPQIHIENRFCWFRTTFVFVRIVQSLCIQFQLCLCVWFFFSCSWFFFSCSCRRFVFKNDGSFLFSGFFFSLDRVKEKRKAIYNIFERRANNFLMHLRTAHISEANCVPVRMQQRQQQSHRHLS